MGVMLLLKAFLGALIVVLIDLVSRTRFYFVAGLVPLFPTFALVSHIVVAQRGSFFLKNTALFGVYSLLPYLAYLLSVYFLAGRLPLWVVLSFSVAVWGVFALTVFLAFNKS